MVATVKFLIFAHGNFIRSEESVSYDRDPLKKIRVQTDASYEDLVNAICAHIYIDRTTHQITVHHRHPKFVEGRVYYSLLPIRDDTDVEDLVEMAEKKGEEFIQELYIEISERSIALSEHEMPQADTIMPLSPKAPLSKCDRTVQNEDFMPKRPRYDIHLSKDISDIQREMNRVPEDPPTEMGENLVITDLRYGNPSQNVMIHKLDDPVASPISPSQMSMNITNGMEEDNQTLRAGSSTTPPPAQDYEVFLSFTGKDTRHGFTDHLYNGLVNVGVLVFRDDNKLRVGKEIGPELLKAIKASRISIPIISKTYASSSWCLRELVQILECKKTSSQVVLPIFYQVEPSEEVRNQTGDFGKGFLLCKNKHDGEESLIQEWKNALVEVSYLKGWESSKISNGHEGELVRVIVHEVLQLLRKFALPISDHLVGVEDHVQTIIKGITDAKESNDVQAIVIHGMGGIGKTTLAKFLYNRLCNQFEHCSFLANIRATSQHHKGIEDLQKQLISNISRGDENISNVDQGATIIKARCSRKKVLILLDDIDHKDQLDALVGKPDWFGRGTIIIITSRGKNLLKNWEDSFTYELNGLNANQSFMLFCMHAFKRSDSIPDEYNSIAKEIVSTTRGLPLAIEVIGSLLYGKGKSYWEGKLKILKEIPHLEVQKKLKISFDALEQEEKEIFLDIACLRFYGEEEREFAFRMWDSFGYFPQDRIENLISLSLIQRGKYGEFIIHDQLRDLGREIVRKENIDDPGQRSRIWKEEDAREVLEFNKGTGKIETLNLWRWLRFEPVHCTSKQYERMTKHLSMYKVNLEGDFQNLFQNLRWLDWNSGQLDFMRSNFIPKKLVVLKLFDVNIVEQWMGWRQMKLLRVLNLSYCYELINLPDISALKELEVLILKSCRNLRNIDPSISKLKELTKLDLQGTKITRLPDSIGDLHNLELLDLSSTEVTQLPDSVCDLHNLELLHLSNTHIRCLPTSIRMLSKLQKLDLWDCLQIEWLPNLPSSLTSLKFSGYLIKTLPDFSSLTNLEHLQFTALQVGRDSVKSDEVQNESENINLLLELPSTLVELELISCFTLRTLPNFSDLKNLTDLYIYNCPELMKIDGLDGAESLTSVKINSCEELSKLGGMGISVTDLKLEDLDSLMCLPDLSTAKKLKNLRISNCRNLREIQGLDNAEGIESVVIDGCSSLERIGDLSNLKMLTWLELCDCEKLTETLPDFSNLTNLEHLEFTHDFRRWDTTLNFRNLNRITTLQLGSDGVNADSFDTDPFFWECLIHGSDEGFESAHINLLLELPSTLVKLELISCFTLLTLPNFSDLKNLTDLYIKNCPELMKIDGLDGAESLTSVKINSCKKLSKLGGMGISVTDLKLKDLDSLMCLPDLSIAKKLKNLRISNCRNLREIQGLGNAKMLTTLKLWYCKKLSDVQGIEKLTSLTSLSIIGCHPKIKFDLSMLDNQNVHIVVEPHEEQVGGYLPDMFLLKNSDDIVEESCEISLRCPAPKRLPDHQNVHLIAEPLEEQEGGYSPDLTQFKISTDMVEESCEISLGCPAFGSFPIHQNVCTIAESPEEQEVGFVPDLSQFKNSNDIVEEICEISLGCPSLERLSDYQSVSIVAEPLEEQ